MRPIKFRAWSPLHKKMYATEDLRGFRWSISFGGDIAANSAIYYGITLMQSTVLLDSRNHEIFENDIVQSIQSRQFYEVRWSDDSPGWDPFLWPTWDGENERLSGRSVVIVGNKWENPQLLDSVE